jgi:hypothetical protein
MVLFIWVRSTQVVPEVENENGSVGGRASSLPFNLYLPEQQPVAQLLMSQVGTASTVADVVPVVCVVSLSVVPVVSVVSVEALVVLLSPVVDSAAGVVTVVCVVCYVDGEGGSVPFRAQAGAINKPKEPWSSEHQRSFGLQPYLRRPG